MSATPLGHSDDPSTFRVLFHGSEVPRDLFAFKDAAITIVEKRVIPVLNKGNFFQGSPLDHVDILVHYIDREHQRVALRIHPRFRFHWRKPALEGILLGVFAISSRIRKTTVREFASYLEEITVEVLEAVAKKYDCDANALLPLKSKKRLDPSKDPFCGRPVPKAAAKKAAAKKVSKKSKAPKKKAKKASRYHPPR